MARSEEYKARKRAWYHKNKNTEKATSWRKNYYLKNKDTIITKTAEYKKDNKDKVRERNREYISKKRQSLEFRLYSNIRSRISGVIKKRCEVSGSLVLEFLGCSMSEFKIHIESQFIDDMTWDNYGRLGWHIDHIIPISKATNKEEFVKLNHYTNLRPLWAKENQQKGNKFNE